MERFYLHQNQLISPERLNMTMKWTPIAWSKSRTEHFRQIHMTWQISIQCGAKIPLNLMLNHMILSSLQFLMMKASI